MDFYTCNDTMMHFTFAMEQTNANHHNICQYYLICDKGHIQNFIFIVHLFHKTKQ